MPNRNQITIMGHLGRDPEQRALTSGQMVTSFSVATSNDYKDRNGEWIKRDATWWNCSVWGDLGDEVIRNFYKGDAIMVVGKAGVREYEAKDGTTKAVPEVRVSEVFKPIYVKKERVEEPPRTKRAAQELDFGDDIGPGEDSDIPF